MREGQNTDRATRMVRLDGNAASCMGDSLMSFFESSRQAKFVRHEEKLENLSRFAGFYLDRLSVAEDANERHRSVSLLVRSPLSPAAVALIDAMKEFQALGVGMRIAFVRLEPEPALAHWLELTEQSSLDAPAVAVRWARHPALIDAHEQLVLGVNMTWIGDCMRREPERRDAYETFHTFDNAAARQASGSFEALWAMSTAVPGSLRRPVVAPAGAQVDLSAPAAPGSPAAIGASAVTASTRH